MCHQQIQIFFYLRLYQIVNNTFIFFKKNFNTYQVPKKYLFQVNGSQLLQPHICTIRRISSITSKILGRTTHHEHLCAILHQIICIHQNQKATYYKYVGRKIIIFQIFQTQANTQARFCGTTLRENEHYITSHDQTHNIM